VRRALLIAALLSLAVAAPAGACSCAALPATERLAEADGAFVGAVQSTRSEGGLTFTTFRVLERYKGDLAETVEVQTGQDGNTCSLDLAAGQRVGLFLTRSSGPWHAGLCDTVSPQALREAGAGTVATVVAGSFAGSRLLALDADGRLVSRGEGAGEARQVDVCPGGLYAVEAYVSPRGWRLAVRELPALTLVGERRIPAGADADVLVHCYDRLARRPSILASEGGRTVLRRLRRGRIVRLYSARATAAGFGYGAAYLQTRRGTVAVDTVSGRRGVLAGPRRLSGEAAGGPEGFVAGRSGPYAMLVGPTGRVWRARVGRHVGPVVWSTDLRRPYIAVTRAGGRVSVFDGLLRRRGSFGGFAATSMAARGDRLWGIDAGNQLLTARLPGGPGGVLVALPPGTARDVAAVPEGVGAAQASASQARMSEPCSSRRGGRRRT
jgi:hypothetical protein